MWTDGRTTTDDGRTPDPWVSYKLTGEPEGSGELKTAKFSVDYHEIAIYPLKTCINSNKSG